jgi:hypothetical protein
LKSFAISERSFTFAPVTALGASLIVVTAPLRSWAVPTLVAAQVVPPRARNTAAVAITLA